MNNVNIRVSLKNLIFRRGGESSRKTNILGWGNCQKKGRLGQFADLRGGLVEKREVVFFEGGGVDTPMHTMRLVFSVIVES